MGGLPKQTIHLSVSARNQTKDSWTWNLAVSGSGKGTRMRVGWTKQQRAVDGGPGREQLALDSREAVDGDPDESSWRWTAERRAAESWRGTTDRGNQHRTPEYRGEAAWDRVQRQWVKMSLIPVALWNFR